MKPKIRLGDHVLVPASALTFPLQGRVDGYGGRTVTTKIWLDDLPIDAVEIQPAERCTTCGRVTDDDD